MTTTAIGVAIPRLGQARHVSLSQGRYGPELERSFYSIDPLMLRSAQPEQIKVDWAHTNAILGDVVSLQLRGGQLWATGELHGDPPDTDTRLFWSAATDSERDGTDVRITRCAITTDPAMIAMTPLTLLAGELTARNVDRWRAQRRIDDNQRDALEHAANTKADRRGGPIVVADEYGSSMLVRSSRRPPGGPWISQHRGWVIGVR